MTEETEYPLSEWVRAVEWTLLGKPKWESCQYVGGDFMATFGGGWTQGGVEVVFCLPGHGKACAQHPGVFIMVNIEAEFEVESPSGLSDLLNRLAGMERKPTASWLNRLDHPVAVKLEADNE